MNTATNTELAAIAAQQDAARRDDDHGPALLMNAEYDAAALARCTATAQAMLTNGRSIALPESYSERDALIDAADAQDELFPTDAELVEEIRRMCAEVFNMVDAETDERMATFDWARAVGEVAA